MLFLTCSYSAYQYNILLLPLKAIYCVDKYMRLVSQSILEAPHLLFIRSDYSNVELRSFELLYKSCSHLKFSFILIRFID